MTAYPVYSDAKADDEPVLSHWRRSSPSWNEKSEDWWKGSLDGKSGIFPKSCGLITDGEEDKSA